MILLEYNKNNASCCWKCKRKFRYDTVRMQASISFGGYDSDPGHGPKKWMHLRCYRPSRRVDWNLCKGTAKLTEQDKEGLQTFIEKWNRRLRGMGNKKEKITTRKTHQEHSSESEQEKVKQTLHPKIESHFHLISDQDFPAEEIPDTTSNGVCA